MRNIIVRTGSFWRFQYHMDLSCGYLFKIGENFYPHDKLFIEFALNNCSNTLLNYLPKIKKINDDCFQVFELLEPIETYELFTNKVLQNAFSLRRFYISQIDLTEFKQFNPVYEYLQLALKYQELFNCQFKFDFSTTNIMWRNESQLVFNDCLMI